MKSVLVTGHCGYIGSHFFEPWMEGCDLKFGQDFAGIKGKSYDVVVHLAASVSVTESFNKAEEYFRNNCFKLLAFLNNNTVWKMVFASTGGAMYGDKIGAKEDDAYWGNCKSPYAQSKYLAEEVILTLCRDYVILRLGNVFGGDQSIRGEANVHAHFAQDDPIVVYGGEQTRDFVHVESVVKALRHALNSNALGTFNIGSGLETSISKLAQYYSHNRQVQIEYRPPRHGEVNRISLDCSAALKAGFAYLQSPNDNLPVPSQRRFGVKASTEHVQL